jgi:NDP-sugar pyrophosphorylase family protein
MRAMILAAGLGTRLRPLTNDRPKALVQISERTLLEVTLSRLRMFGIREVIINVHHFADMILDYLNIHGNFGMRIEISREDELLDTGGGLKKAAHFFLEAGEALEKPFILHNVDVISTIDLESMVRFHIENDALATLAVRDRPTSRYLLFDEQLQLRGRRSFERNRVSIIEDSPRLQALAFSGIHVISPRFLNLMEEQGAFSIIDTYLRLAAHGHKILAFRSDQYYWRDLGTPDNLIQAAQDLQQRILL